MLLILNKIQNNKNYHGMVCSKLPEVFTFLPQKKSTYTLNSNIFSVFNLKGVYRTKFVSEISDLK